MEPIQIRVQERDRKYQERVTSVEERRYVVQHLVRQKQKAQTASVITNVDLYRYVVMQSPKHPGPNVQLVGAQVECAILAEPPKSGGQAKGTYIPYLIREYIYNRRLGI